MPKTSVFYTILTLDEKTAPIAQICVSAIFTLIFRKFFKPILVVLTVKIKLKNLKTRVTTSHPCFKIIRTFKNDHHSLTQVVFSHVISNLSCTYHFSLFIKIIIKTDSKCLHRYKKKHRVWKDNPMCIFYHTHIHTQSYTRNSIRWYTTQSLWLPLICVVICVQVAATYYIFIILLQ